MNDAPSFATGGSRHDLLARLQAALAPVAADRPTGPGSTHPSGLTPAGVLIPIIKHARPSLILLRRAAHLRLHAGQIAFPGGKLEAGEDVQDCALREAWEEIALPQDQVNIMGVAGARETTSGYMVTAIAGLLAPETRAQMHPLRTEVADIFEVPLDYIFDPAHIHPCLPSGPWGASYEIMWQGVRIWGLTAWFIARLARMVTHAH